MSNRVSDKHGGPDTVGGTFSDDFEDLEALPEPDAPDPGEAVAAVLVRRAFDAEPGLRERAARRGGAVVVEVAPGAEWLLPVAIAWLDHVWRADSYGHTPGHGGVFRPHRYRAGEDRRPAAVAPCDAYLRDGAVVWARRSDEDSARVGRALACGRAVVGFSQAPGRFLPDDLLLAADLHVALPALDAATLAEAAKAVAGSAPTTAFPEHLARFVTMGDLRLARRPGEDADAWFARLRALAERKLAQPKSDGGPTLDDLAGMDEAVAWGKALARDLADYGAGRLPWSQVDRGCLLHGPPGTGKTTFARALGRSCGVPLLSGSLAEWQASGSGYLGDLLRAMRGRFDEARRAAPCILFIDEADGFGDRAKFHARHRDYSTQVVNALLECLDGLSGREGVVVVGACNDPARLDPAIVRAGRLDRLVAIPLPDRAALGRILRHHLGADLPGADLSGAALGLLGASGADAERAVRGARRRARHAGRPLAPDDLLAEVRGGEDGDGRSPEYRRVVAAHEAGHALLEALGGRGAVLKVTIRGTETTAGGVVTRWPPEHLAPTRAWMEAELRRILAGRAAEEVLLGEVTAGSGGSAASDLARATWLATAAITAFGTEGGEDALLWLGLPDADGVGSFLAARPVLARRVAARLAEAYAGVRGIIEEHRSVVERIAQRLLEKELLEGFEVEELVVTGTGGDEAAATAPLARQAAGDP